MFLGEMYQNGTGVKQDLSKAVELYRQSIQETDASEAYACLGQLYDRGEGVEWNLEEAARLYGIAVSKGHVEARLQLFQLFQRVLCCWMAFRMRMCSAI